MQATVMALLFHLEALHSSHHQPRSCSRHGHAGDIVILRQDWSRASCCDNTWQALLLPVH